MSLMKRTGSNLSWILLSDMFAKGSMVFATVYLARVLGVVEFGIFSLGISIANSIWPIVDLGVNGFGTREVAQNKKSANELISTLNSLRLFASLIITTCAFLVLFNMGMDNNKTLALAASLLYLPCYAFCPDWVVRGLEKMNILFLINVTTAVVFIGGVLLLVHSPDNLVDASLARALSFGAGSVMGVVFLFSTGDAKFGIKISIKKWWNLLQKTYFFLLIRVATNLAQYLPVFFVSAMLTDVDVGIFSAPHRLYIIAFGGLAAVISAIYPILSSINKRGNEEFHRYQRLIVQALLTVFMPLAALGILVSDEIILVIFGEEYLASSSVLTIMLVTLLFVSMRSFFMFTLMSGGKEKSTYPVLILIVVLQLLVAWQLVGRFGVMGAAMSMLLGEVFACIAMVSISNRLLGVAIPLDRALCTLFSIVLVMTFVSWKLDLSIFQVLFIGGPIYLLLLPLTGLISIKKVKSLVNRKS